MTPVLHFWCWNDQISAKVGECFDHKYGPVYRKVSPEIFLLPCFRPKLQTCNPMNKWSCFQEHGTTKAKIHLSLFYFCPWTKRSWLRNFHGRHAGSEAAEAPWSCATWLLGDTWNRRGLTRITAFSWAWRVASGLPCVSALAAAKDGQFEHVLELHAILQEISTFAWLWYAMKPPAMSVLALHKQLPGWFYILHFRKLSNQMCILQSYDISWTLPSADQHKQQHSLGCFGVCPCVFWTSLILRKNICGLPAGQETLAAEAFSCHQTLANECLFYVGS